MLDLGSLKDEPEYTQHPMRTAAAWSTLKEGSWRFILRAELILLKMSTLPEKVWKDIFQMDFNTPIRFKLDPQKKTGQQDFIIPPRLIWPVLGESRLKGMLRRSRKAVSSWSVSQLFLFIPDLSCLYHKKNQAQHTYFWFPGRAKTSYLSPPPGPAGRVDRVKFWWSPSGFTSVRAFFG